MKLRQFLVVTSLFFIVPLAAQMSEETYLGNIAVEGFEDDLSLGPYNIGFPFSFYGNNYTQFYINSNGQILFGSGSSTGEEALIPTAAAPNNFIAAFWDDLIVDSYGKILYKTIDDEPDRKLIVQFKNMGFYPAPANLGTFSVILYETSNVIQIQYRLIVLSTSIKVHGGSATIGIENSTGTSGVQYAYHNPDAVNTEQAISFTPIAGPDYTINTNAIYDSVYLTTNLSLPEPGIPLLINPPPDAGYGSDFTFEWASAPYADSYTLYIGSDPELIGADAYPAGSSLTYDIVGLTLDEIYYWGVFSKNTTGTTWCEIRRLNLTSTPCILVPQTLFVEQNHDKTITLNYTGCDESPKTAIITSLPAEGELYQYNSGSRGDLISTVPITVTDMDMNVIYAAPGSTGSETGNFNYRINDASGYSPEETITVNVTVATGMENYEPADLIIYPNPAKDHIIISTGHYSMMPDYSIRILNSLGTTVFETRITQAIYEINLSAWSGKGIYVLQVYDNSNAIIATKKIVLQ